MQQPKRELTFRDLVLLVLGSIIGSGIFFVPGGMLAEANLSAWTTVLAWLAGAAIAMSGALMFAQLGAAFPQAGGQVAFLHKGLGRLPAFLFSWTGFTVVQSGTIAAIAVAMAQAVDGVWDLPGDSTPWRGLELPGWGVAFLAVGIIALLTLVNLRGVRDGAAVNNAAAFAKTFGLLLLVVVVFALGKGSGNLTGGAPGLGAAGFAGFGGALLLCLFAYDGFAQATFVSAEAKDPARTVPRAIVVGVLAVAAVYILATLAYLHAIPVQEVAPAVLQGERSIAQDAARSVGGEGFALLIALA
ncbi:MAG TPA: APC family permease, partial [Candidatus Thermoplasmatota archaeon]|nr:APC family permease [Candidatus Thermoplasmatota archaeon]